MPDKRIVVWIQKRSDRANLTLDWHDPANNGKRMSQSAGTADPGAAETARADLEYELNHNKRQAASRLTWERFREMFEEEYLGGLNRRERTCEKYATVLDVFEEICRPAKLRAITERTISAFVTGMRARPVHPKRKPPSPADKNKSLKAKPETPTKIGLAPMTIRKYLVSLRTALTWAVEQKLIPDCPQFPSISVPKKKPQPVSAEAFERLLDKAPDDRWRTFLLCGWWGGLRLSEAHQLRWERSDKFPWIDFERNRVMLPAEFAKSTEDQWIPLHPTLLEALQTLERTGSRVFPFRSQQGGGNLSRKGVTSRVLSIAKRAGVKLSMHKLRKGFGCRVAKQLGKGQAPVLHSLMRHSSMQITMDYYASVDDVLQDAIKQLE